MNFTREPIIETIISPKEGCKLLVRNSKGTESSEEYYVDAVEVVSFGRAFFFRSQERPKPFLVPVSDYEILEVKETRVALKNVSHERNIKIGGGREGPMRHQHREPQEREPEPQVAEEEQAPAAEETVLEAAVTSRMDKRRDRRRRHRRRSDEQDWSERKPMESQETAEGEAKGSEEKPDQETKTSSSVFTHLIPPPPTLISETLSRYKDKEFMEPKEHNKREKEEKNENPPDEEDLGAGSSPLNRVSAESADVTYTSTSFSLLKSAKDFFF